MKKIIIIVSIVLFSALSLYSQERPFVMGYMGGQQQPIENGTVQVSFGGGIPNATQWSALTPDNMRVMLGFRYNTLYVQNAFDKELFASKGYYSDYVELRWELARYENQVTGFKVYRKILNSTDDSTMVASLSADVRSWRDEYTESNVIYQYTVIAQGITKFNQKMMNYIDGIGFRVPYGRIYGRVTYKGGTAVEGVRLIAETEDDFSGSSLKLNGTSSYLVIAPPTGDPNFKFDNEFTFQAWFKPNASATSCLVEKQGQYKITHSAGQINFTAAGQTVTLNFTQKVDTFFNVTAIRGSDDTLRLFVIYDYENYFQTKAKLTVATPANDNAVYIGKSSLGEYFNGWVDEVRIWHKGLTPKYAIESAIMYIAGTETGLTAYYRMNENTGTAIYDLSRKGFTFNEEHGLAYQTTWSSNVPFSRQLSVMGMTDNNGNYIISGIPFETDGSIYRIVPIFGTHTFEPNEKLLFIGPGSTSHSNIDFTDVASFTVTANIYYKNTRFPVSDVFVKIDGISAVSGEGMPIMSDASGKVTLDVPIGKHFITFEKVGHGFENDGRFPALGLYADDRFDFQENFSIQYDILDTTLVKVVGKVVGGPKQAAMPIGLGKSKNNIGNAKIVLGTVKGFDLIGATAPTLTSSWNNQSYENGVLTNKGVTKYEVNSSAKKQIDIFPDETTGEYFAYLLPEKYLVTSVVAGTLVGKYTFDASYHTTIDLTKVSTFKHTEIDSVVVGQVLSSNGRDTIFVYKVDSVNYQHNQDFILRVKPSIDVVNQNDEADFWEAKVKAKDGTTVDVVDANGNPKTNYPIFIQRNQYELEISVFEQYTNSNTSQIDDVPVTDGTVEIQNFLSTNESKVVYKVSKLGTVNYKFTAGLPNITTGGIGDYLKTLNIVAFTGKNGTIKTDWFPGGSGIFDWLPSGEVFKGYVLGGMPTGNNFVTLGPSKVDMILRDPPGSGSYSFFEKGKSVSKTTTFDVQNSNSGTESLTFQLGAEVKVFAGVGAGTITETEYSHDVTVGIEHEETWVKGNTTSSTTTTTERWATSAESDFVGDVGDVFIGHSTNIVYGMSFFIDLVPETQCVGCVTDTELPSYSIGTHKAVRVNPKFGTGFIYSQNHIQNYLIPNLRMLRNNFFANRPDVYQCVICDPNNPKYGTNNTTGSTNSTGYSGGDVYNITIPAGWAADSLFVDSVKFYNQQIAGWEELMARNEREKVEAKTVRNHSFDAGAVYENTITYEDSETTSSSFEWSISPKLSLDLGFSFNKFGMKVGIEESYKHVETNSTEDETVNSVSFGYVLTDTDEGDYFSIDVKEPKTQTGPVFYTKGGQTSCPYEGAITTKYHNPGTILSEATMQREKPLISVENAIVAGVPEDDAAVFNVQLRNISETGDDSWFFLVIDEASNQNGALIKMDGSAIGNGRLIKISAGTTLNKIITIEKTVASVYDYNNIGLILRSVCQWDVGTFPDISDTVQVTAKFQPVCSKVDITQLNDKWVTNTNTIDTKLSIGINNYNLAHLSLERIAFQYKSSASSQWITEMTFYKDMTDFTAANDPKTHINGATSLTYDWYMKDFPDRNYDIRVQTQCADGTENNSVILSGIKDTKRPTVFGTPQPGDGILSPGEDILLTFNEKIDEATILGSNFTIKGVLNGTKISHNACIYFDGQNDYLSNIAGVDIQNKSFTVEFWAKRTADVQGVVFSQEDIKVGFDAGNHLFIKFGNETVTSASTFTSASGWNHYAISYNYVSKKVSMYVSGSIVMEDVTVANSLFVTEGRMQVGQSLQYSDNFTGYLHDLRVWDKARGFGTVASQMNVTLSGSEVGLVGYWAMNEAVGDYAADLSRNHNATLFDAAWAVFPKGYVKTFAGNSYVNINTASSVIITKEMDYTLEFWFRHDGSSNKVMFSSGKGDGTDVMPDFENILLIGFDDQSNLYFKNNGTTATLTTELYNNNDWHHLALVVNRSGNANLYIDGNLKIYEQSSVFGGLSASEMSIGARRNYAGGTTTYDQYFNGAIDELRIWKLARTAKLIQLDMNSKLQGDELGLLAYYPFEEYDINLVLQPSLKDKDFDEYANPNPLPSTLVATANGGGFDNTNVPNIREARPKQKILAFNWVVNNDQIVINIDEDPALIEKCVLEFTVDNIEDMQENRMASPVTWTAYINKNTVIWNKSSLVFEKPEGDKLSFTVDVENIGGVEQNFEIKNLPSWLTVDISKGSLLPVSKKTITFTIDEFTNIGQYESSVFLTSDFGYNEKLNINLKVFRTPPTWTVNPNDFQYSMGVIGQIKIENKFSTNPDDILYAFVGNECRGLAKLQYIEQYDIFEAYVNVYSNQELGEKISFRIWNASKGIVHENVTIDGSIISSVTFESNSLIGAPALPKVLETNAGYSREIPLVKGWKWISVNIADPNLSDVNKLFAQVSAQNDNLIKTQTVFDIYNSTYGWSGSLSNNGGFTYDKMYMVNLQKADTLKLIGSKIAPLSSTFTFKTGWNWIGYTPDVSISVNDALANYNANSGDIIKGQYAFAIYDQYLNWVGSLKSLQAGEGYMLKNNGVVYSNFVYPNGGLAKFANTKDENPSTPWSIVPEKYQFNASIIGVLTFDNEEITENSVIGAFVGNECRGIVKPIEIDGELLYFITVYANTMNETLNFRMFDLKTQKEFSINENIQFATDALTGSIANPFVFTINKLSTSISEQAFSSIKVYPNPSNGFFELEVSNRNQAGMFNISDVSGKIVYSSEIISDKTAIDLSKIAKGVYFINVTFDNQTVNQKLIIH